MSRLSLMAWLALVWLGGGGIPTVTAQVPDRTPRPGTVTAPAPGVPSGVAAAVGATPPPRALDLTTTAAALRLNASDLRNARPMVLTPERLSSPDGELALEWATVIRPRGGAYVAWFDGAPTNAPHPAVRLSFMPEAGRRFVLDFALSGTRPEDRFVVALEAAESASGRLQAVRTDTLPIRDGHVTLTAGPYDAGTRLSVSFRSPYSNVRIIPDTWQRQVTSSPFTFHSLTVLRLP